MANEMEKMDNFIVVDDGAERVPIRNTLGEEIGVFYFNPTDVGIVKRFQEVAGKFSDVASPLSEIDINPDGTTNTESERIALEKAEQKLFELVNYLFGGDCAGAFFGKMNPFSPVGGKFYAENVLNSVSAYISKRFQTETERVSQRVDKYTHGYRTGKHKDGKK